MPSIAHLILGFGLGLCLYYLSNGKFSKNHVFILCLNNYLGPDVGWAIGIGSFTHTLVGYFFFAFILAIFYHYFTRFTITFESKKIEIIDLERPKLSYINTHFLVLAGGVMHVYLDGAMNNAGVFYLVPALGANKEISWSLVDFINFWREGALNINPVISLAIGIVLIVLFIFVSTWFIQTYTKKSGLIMVLFIAIFMGFYYCVGSMSTAHAEGGAILYIAIFWLTPLFLCVLSTTQIRFIRKKEKKAKEKKEGSGENLGLFALNLVYITLGIIMLGGGAFVLILKTILLNSIFTEDTIKLSYGEEIFAAIDIASLILIGIGALIIKLGILLTKSSEHHKNLLIISMWFFLSGTIGIIASVTGMLLKDYIVDYVFSNYNESIAGYINPASAVTLVIVLTSIILAFAILNIVLAIGLSIKNRKLWRLSILYNLMLSWTIIGLTIACALSENSVKRLFKPREYEKQ